MFLIETVTHSSVGETVYKNKIHIIITLVYICVELEFQDQDTKYWQCGLFSYVYLCIGNER